MSLIASHRDLDLDLLERLSAGAQSVGQTVAAMGAAPTSSTSKDAGPAGPRGALVLATCNRFEVYLELRPGQDPRAVIAAATSVIATASGLAADDVAASLRVLRGREVPAHLFSVAAGLDSMVVGEREISGQVRRSLSTARAAGTTSSGLERLFQTAARTSRDVGARTGLGAAGRSVVGVALDLAEADLPAWAHTAVVLIGTGSYAGASVAALHRRGCRDIRVFSPSGRAPGFAHDRGAVAIPDDGLEQALTAADLVVACSGAVGGVIDAASVARARATSEHPRVIVDLALRHDVDPAVGALPGVRLIDLATVRDQAPVGYAEPVERARRLVADATETFEAVHRALERDAEVVVQRRRVLGPLEAEAARLRASAEPEIVGRAVRALRRRTRTLLHDPTVRARAAALAGDDGAFAAALDELAAIPVPSLPAPPSPAPAPPVPARPVPTAVDQSSSGPTIVSTSKTSRRATRSSSSAAGTTDS
ncbi:glutamyl-tRNA reductase [Pengzhenrongella frigida]|uniref:Glutamyl-tRNA reductase n=1 Tax=Pengzhenrongella frigida TaxID=1259133 RepID=A0A4Q5MZG0_9MICO|nr:glutamyl-tRNA reductase [Cellulomonas sp. HLT2-17]RYV51148.1 glutamyl-tRNA reductase [Cellulomonas sp. HLT2-17]